EGARRGDADSQPGERAGPDADGDPVHLRPAAGSLDRPLDLLQQDRGVPWPPIGTGTDRDLPDDLAAGGRADHRVRGGQIDTDYKLRWGPGGGAGPADTGRRRASMEQESSRKPGARRAWSVAAVLAIAVFGVGAGVAVSGCGGDDNNDSGNVNSAIDSIQAPASRVGSQGSNAPTHRP